MTQILNFKYRLRGRGSQQRRAEAECFSINWQKDERRRGEAKKKRPGGNETSRKKKNIKGKLWSTLHCFCTRINAAAGCTFSPEL